MRRYLWLFATLGPALAQPSFEVASVRVTPPGKIGYTSISAPGAPTFTATNVTLEVLIGIAYGIDSDRISGKDWLSSDHYDVTAKAEGGNAIPADQLKPMLQQLLAERFKLSLHREMKDVSGYALVLAKDSSKLRSTKGGEARPIILKGAIRANNVPMIVFAGLLARPAGRPVADRTGVEGNFDFNFLYAPEGDTDSTLPSLFTALQEQLGLRLTPQKVPIEIFVVDHAEKLPTEN